MIKYYLFYAYLVFKLKIWKGISFLSIKIIDLFISIEKNRCTKLEKNYTKNLKYIEKCRGNVIELTKSLEKHKELRKEIHLCEYLLLNERY